MKPLAYSIVCRVLLAALLVGLAAFAPVRAQGPSNTTKEVEDLRKEVENLQNQLDRARQRIASLNEEISRLRNQLANARHSGSDGDSRSTKISIR